MEELGFSGRLFWVGKGLWAKAYVANPGALMSVVSDGCVSVWKLVSLCGELGVL